jgi:hypothetical protein
MAAPDQTNTQGCVERYAAPPDKASTRTVLKKMRRDWPSQHQINARRGLLKPTLRKQTSSRRTSTATYLSGTFPLSGRNQCIDIYSQPRFQTPRHSFPRLSDRCDLSHEIAFTRDK